MQGQGADKLMRVALILAVCIVILLIGWGEVAKEKSVSKALAEIIKFINFYDTQLNYKRTDFEELCDQGKRMGLRYISFDDCAISLSGDISGALQKHFSEFVDRIGTTDTYGQTSLCKEYLDRFGELLSERKALENNKIRVNIAVSILSAVGVFITFI